MLNTGPRWRDCPAEYGLLYDRLQPLQPVEQAGVWEAVFYALTGLSGVIGAVAGTSTPHQGVPFGGGRKGGLQERNRPIARRTDD